MKKLFCVSCLIICSCLETTSTLAEEWKSEASNFAITFPTGWQLTSVSSPPAETKIVAQDPEKIKTIAVMVYPAGTGAKLDKQYISMIEGPLLKVGKKISSRSLSIGGNSAYESVLNIQSDGKAASMIIQMVVDGERFYGLQAAEINQDVTNDPEIQASLASFRFLKSTVAPSRLQGKNAAYKAGYLMGYLALPLGLVALIIVIIVVKRTKRKHPVPPPLPTKLGGA